MKLGALPPEDQEWQIGKTAASIAYVKSANHILEVEVLTEVEAARLKENINLVKTGKKVFHDFVSRERILDVIKNPYPAGGLPPREKK